MNQEEQKGLIYMTTATVRKWGNSLAVRIPQEVSQLVKFDDGVEVEMLVNEKKEIILRHAYPDAEDQEALRKHFLSLRAKCKPEMDTHEEIFNEPIGDEVI